MAVDFKRLTLGAMVALFALPLIAAWVMVTNRGWLPDARSNHGILIEPPVTTGFRGGWTLVVPEDRHCGAECKRLKDVAVIVRRALAPEVRQLTAMADCGESKSECGALARALGEGASLVLVDPEGNAMLRYGPQVAPRELLQDVQRLLKAASYWRNDGTG